MHPHNCAMLHLPEMNGNIYTFIYPVDVILYGSPSPQPIHY